MNYNITFNQWNICGKMKWNKKQPEISRWAIWNWLKIKIWIAGNQVGIRLEYKK